MSWLSRAADGSVILTLHIQPGAKKTEITGLHGEALKIRLAAPPVDGKANACLIEFLSGISVTEPTPAQCLSAGQALGAFHRAAEGFAAERRNTLDPAGWHDLAHKCGAHLDDIAPGLAARVAQELAFLDAHWPVALERGVIHADLFPDNVLMSGDTVTGLIDFYFSCTDIRAYDLGITHGAWCFSADGATYHAARGAALVRGYTEAHGLSEAERTAFPILCRGAALRGILDEGDDLLVGALGGGALGPHADEPLAVHGTGGDVAADVDLLQF